MVKLNQKNTEVIMKVTVWNENYHEKIDPAVGNLYPGGLHEQIAGFLRADDVIVRTASLDMPECGLTDEMLNNYHHIYFIACGKHNVERIYVWSSKHGNVFSV